MRAVRALRRPIRRDAFDQDESEADEDSAAEDDGAEEEDEGAFDESPLSCDFVALRGSEE